MDGIAAIDIQMFTSLFDWENLEKPLLDNKLFSLFWFIRAVASFFSSVISVLYCKAKRNKALLSSNVQIAFAFISEMKISFSLLIFVSFPFSDDKIERKVSNFCWSSIFSNKPIPHYYSIYSTICIQLKHSIRTIHKNCTNIK